MRSLVRFVVAAALLAAACGHSDSNKNAKATFRQTREAAMASREKGASLEAAARPFVGAPMEFDVIADESQGGIRSTSFEVTSSGIKILVRPDRDLDPIKFAIFIEKQQGVRPDGTFFPEEP